MTGEGMYSGPFVATCTRREPDSDLVVSVKSLEKRLDAVSDLAGEMMATLVINRDRHAFDDIKEFAEWSKMIDRWRERLGKIQHA